MSDSIAFVVMAAGVGSRYNGIKQLETFGRDKLTIAEYNVLHAIAAGFRDFFFIINDKFAEVFDKRLRALLPSGCNFCLVYQRKEAELLEFCNRSKPWGTGHAILCCEKFINCNFCVSNADDLYGADAIARVAGFSQTTAADVNTFANVAYSLADTLSDDGTVSRGIIHSLDQENIAEIEEVTKIDHHTISCGRLSGSALTSMNLWGFTPRVFRLLRAGWEQFKLSSTNMETDEFYLPTAINSAIKNQQCTVKILRTSARWHGITYKSDKGKLEQFLNH